VPGIMDGEIFKLARKKNNALISIFLVESAEESIGSITHQKDGNRE
jgi:hypothetical protein